MRGKSEKIWADVDWTIVLIYFVIIGLSVSNIYSAVYDPEKPGLFNLGTEHGKQIMWAGVSLFLGVIIMFLDGSFIRKSAYWVYGVIVFMLVAVLFTEPINGAKSWFGFGSFGIQPSELGKLGAALALSAHLASMPALKARQKPSISVSYFADLFNTHWKTLVILGIPAILVLLQPDMGTFIIFTSFILVLYREGYAGNILLFMVIAVIIAVITLIVADSTYMLPGLKIKMSGKTGIVVSLLLMGLTFFFIIKYFVLKRNRPPLYRALVGSLVVAILFVNFIEWGYSTFLQDHQKTRIDLVLGKIEDPNGEGYNINRAKAAIGSGGFAGKGYKQATLANAQQGHVPMQSTDFIFCTWSEERGFIGSFFLVLLYTILLIKLVSIAERQRSKFTRIFAYSVAGIFFYHFMINVGMAIGLAPVIGIPLPLFSYGGSQVLTFSLLLFILVKLDSERKIVLQ
ncbi:rod shape-determining protein RodA [Paracrocinitomix mangrovi]|uniref:rod shape-determining protein RodA n=1 Tax=Paracrocinitomix mangrovi TaxID=2862509 RepID=UPI001C8EA46C|nr:rod shape-determining protein RodA [Paracrocinitomix mangrovi]UKN00685.1 rod shape-determining protein RodA [Paracrocinitomix mangrovi]